MDPKIVYAKTPIGDEAVRQSTRVVQRNLRMVLVQVDGKTSAEELAGKIGNPRLVENALLELEEGGYIAPTIEAVSVWEESKKAAQQSESQPESAFSEFSTFGSRPLPPDSPSETSNFSSFGKRIFPVSLSLPPNPPNLPEPPSAPHEAAPPHYQKPVSRRRLVFALSVTVIATLISTAVFFPYERYKPALESTISTLVNTPVHIERVSLALFPSPHLKLTNISLGGSVETRISEVRIASPYTLLGSAPHEIAQVDIEDARLRANQLVAMPLFSGSDVSRSGVVIRKVRIEKLQIFVGTQPGLEDIYGEIKLRQTGEIDSANFETADRGMLISARPEPRGIALTIEGRAWKPANGPVLFAALQARGLLQNDRLVVQDIDTTFLGGILKGNWVLDWSNDLSMSADGTFSRLDTEKVGTAFASAIRCEGEMTGTLRLRSNGVDWAGLWKNVDAQIGTEITRGVLHGVDLGEAVRRGEGADVRGGSTKFDRLHATINVSPRQVLGRELRMDAGMVTASGQFSAGRDGNVASNLTVNWQTSVASQRVPVTIRGTLPNLVTSTRK